MIVEVLLKSQTSPILIKDVINAWSEEKFYCVLEDDFETGRVATKWPLSEVVRVKEWD